MHLRYAGRPIQPTRRAALRPFAATTEPTTTEATAAPARCRFARRAARREERLPRRLALGQQEQIQYVQDTLQFRLKVALRAARGLGDKAEV
jgi:hypothetical protein